MKKYRFLIPKIICLIIAISVFSLSAYSQETENAAPVIETNNTFNENFFDEEAVPIEPEIQCQDQNQILYCNSIGCSTLETDCSCSSCSEYNEEQAISNLDIDSTLSVLNELINPFISLGKSLADAGKSFYDAISSTKIDSTFDQEEQVELKSQLVEDDPSALVDKLDKLLESKEIPGETLTIPIVIEENEEDSN